MRSRGCLAACSWLLAHLRVCMIRWHEQERRQRDGGGSIITPRRQRALPRVPTSRSDPSGTLRRRRAVERGFAQSIGCLVGGQAVYCIVRMTSVGGEALEDCDKRLRRQLSDAQDAEFEVIDTSEDGSQTAQIEANIKKATEQHGTTNAVLANIQQEVLDEGLLTVSLREQTATDMGIAKVAAGSVDVDVEQQFEENAPAENQQNEGTASEEAAGPGHSSTTIALAAVVGVLGMLLLVGLVTLAIKKKRRRAGANDDVVTLEHEQSGHVPETKNPMRGDYDEDEADEM